jgi:hypothetical protein
MLTYSKIKDLPIPPEFIITEENLKDIPNPHPLDKEYANWETSLKKIFEKRPCQEHHNFVYIADKQYGYYNGGGCTGRFSLGIYTGPKDVKAKFTAAITGSEPHTANKEHREYLNLLLNPATSPYSWLMKPDIYKVRVDTKGNILGWYILDNQIRAAYMSGLIILERIWKQHGPDNIFWDYWKAKDELPFTGFFLFTHSSYLSQLKSNIFWSGPLIPYSTFDMHYLQERGGFYQGFSAPRLYQGKPNHGIYDKIWTKYDTLLKSNKGHNSSNIVWSSTEGNPDLLLTMKCEKEIKDFVINNTFVNVGFGKLSNPKKIPYLEELLIKYKGIGTSTANNKAAGEEWTTYMLENIHSIITKYTPEFYNEKVA